MKHIMLFPFYFRHMNSIDEMPPTSRLADVAYIISPEETLFKIALHEDDKVDHQKTLVLQ